MDHDPTSTSPGPTEPRHNGPLSGRERLTAVGIGLACIVGCGAFAAAIGVLTGRGMADVTWSAFVYGGLLAAAAVVVYVDRVYARQCPRCRARASQGDLRCPSCSYDVQSRPRVACSEGHGPYLEPGLCPCGRRLRPLERPRGVRPQVMATLGLGAGLLVFLVAVWGVLALLG